MPAEAFARLDSAESEYGRTTRWETLGGAARPVGGAREHRARSGARGGRAPLPGAARGAPGGAGALRVRARATARGCAAQNESRAAGRHAGVRGRVVGARRGALGRRRRRASALAVGRACRCSAQLGSAPWGMLRRRVVRCGGRRRRRRARARPSCGARSRTRRRCACTRSSGACRSRGARAARWAGSSRDRSRRVSTASCGAWGRARRASSTRRCASRTACRSPSSCCARRRRTRPSRAIGCGARPRRSVCRGTRTWSRSSTTGTWPTARRTS